MPECIGEVVPEPVLDVVDERQEHGRDKRRRDADHGAEGDEAQVRASGDLRLFGHQGASMLSRILRLMNISKWFRRKKRSEEELREEEESRLRGAQEARRAEQDSERSRQQSKVPGAGHDSGFGGF